MKIKEVVKKQYTVTFNNEMYNVIKEGENVQIFKKISQDDFVQKLTKFAEVELLERKRTPKIFKDFDERVVEGAASSKEECLVPTEEVIALFATLDLELPSSIYCQDKTLKDSVK